MTHTINTDRTAAVSTDQFWIPIDVNTPLGVKLQLLTFGGIATHGILYRDQTLYTHWTPLPKRREDENG